MKRKDKKVLRIFLIIFVILLIAGVFYFSTKQNFMGGIPGIYSYDDFNDGFLNPLKWSWETFGDDAFSVEGSAGYMTTVIAFPQIPGLQYAEIYSTEIYRSEISNLTIEEFTLALDGDPDSSDGVISSYFYVFGNLIQSETKSNLLGTDLSSEPSNTWEFIKNESEGIDKWDVYKNGVFQNQINGINNKIRIRSEVNGAFSLGSSQSGISSVFYGIDEFTPPPGNATPECIQNSDCIIVCENLNPICDEGICMCESLGQIITPPSNQTITPPSNQTTPPLQTIVPKLKNKSWMILGLGIITTLIIFFFLSKKLKKKRKKRK